MRTNTQYRALFVEYDDILIGKRNGFSDTFFSIDKELDMKHALLVIRYAFETYLKLPPEVLEKKVDKVLMEEMHLLPLMKFIQYPVEYDKEKDYYYLISLLYPARKMNIFDKTIHTYESILANTSVKFPKDYFSGRDGHIRAAFCLQYMINHYVAFHSLNDLYHIFASEACYKYLRKYKLMNICRDYFPSPVDYLHFSLPPSQKNSFLYHYYKFKFTKEMLTDTGRKKQTIMDYKLKGEF